MCPHAPRVNRALAPEPVARSRRAELRSPLEPGPSRRPRAGRRLSRAKPAAGPDPPALGRLPHLARSARHLYVFQRTPSYIDERGNVPT
ncbi:hypothetical protein ABZ656_57410, partial [Streptomyces sp. NPDC007095]|uniref:hypothetical protein n=1 Tax=Streptomyces sp. NPDC007095 TaxID=3154482 RepID=UPI0033D780F4